MVTVVTNVRVVALFLVAGSALLLVATWLMYPNWLRMRARGRRPRYRSVSHAWWPAVTVVVVVQNAEAYLQALLENLLSLAYPGYKRRILIVSDGSTDFTDAIAKLYEHRGVELLRIMRPRGHAVAMNYARRYVRNDIVVVAHPLARMATTALTELIAPFADQDVGVTYGHELGIEIVGGARGRRDTPYTRYESVLRERESRIFGTVSARRTLYALRGPLFQQPVPWWASADFMGMLLAAETGLRSVQVTSARCVMTRPRSLRGDYSRTVSSVSREVLTLLRRPQMLRPGRYGDFAWMLLGHKVGRWLTPWALAAGVLGLVMLAPFTSWAGAVAVAFLVAALLATVSSLVPGRTRMLRRIALPGQVATTAVAIGHASVRAIRARNAVQRGLEPVLV